MTGAGEQLIREMVGGALIAGLAAGFVFAVMLGFGLDVGAWVYRKLRARRRR